jgi:anti-anti-sigma factor
MGTSRSTSMLNPDRDEDAVRRQIIREVAAVHRDFYGESAGGVTVCLEDDLVTVLVEFGPAWEARPGYRGAIGSVLVAIVERATGRPVQGFSGSVAFGAVGPWSAEVFRLEPKVVREDPLGISGVLRRRWAAGPLAITSTAYGDEVLIVSLVGELDLSTVDTAAEALADALAEGREFVVVDCEGLDFVDLSAISMLVSMGRRRGGGSLKILPGSGRAMNRMVELTELGAVVEVLGGGPLDHHRERI